MTERDEADELPEAADAFTSAISSLIVAVMEATETGSPERAAAMNEVLAAADREWVTVMTVKTVILYFLFLTP
jgi:hypothetical protein